ncbi:ParA family protein [Streptomyces alboflavus]|uniref:ParA family protein n=1 Tax=Streptomyces alboflavus TaxID=67267 RepID=UPI0036834E3C
MNQKGGVGKTTGTVNLAACTSEAVGPDEQGRNQVAVVSSDPQGSAVWWAERVEKQWAEQNEHGRKTQPLPFDFIQHTGDPTPLSRLRNSKRYKHIFVDTPGWMGLNPREDEAGQDPLDGGPAGDVMRAVLDGAHNVLVPLPAEGLCFKPTWRTIEKVLKPRGVPFEVYISDWDPRDGTIDRDPATGMFLTKELRETQEFIDKYGWPMSPIVVRHYRIHTNAAKKGQVCTQYERSYTALKAAEDFWRTAARHGLRGAQQRVDAIDAATSVEGAAV